MNDYETGFDSDGSLQASPHPTYADFGAAGHGHGKFVPL